jgi:hypothetical protein
MRGIVLIFVFTLLLSACFTSSGEQCPELPYYPGATKIQSLNQSTSTRVTVYETQDQPNLVLSYYEKQLNQKGWKENSITKDGVEFVYGDRSEFPVVMTIVINDVSPSRVKYSSYILLSSPSGNFNSTCSSLWP